MICSQWLSVARSSTITSTDSCYHQNDCTWLLAILTCGEQRISWTDECSRTDIPASVTYNFLQNPSAQAAYEDQGICQRYGVIGDVIWLSTPPMPIPGICRSSTLKILGVMVTNTLSMAEHIHSIISSCSQTLHALRILRSHRMPDVALFEVFRGVVIAKLSYAASAWWGFASADDKQRLKCLHPTQYTSPAYCV